jgi:hypothetical protein
LTTAGSQLWSQNSPGIAGRAEAHDWFGGALVAGNFGRGPEDDLAVGVNGENDDAGAVNVIYGSGRGLSATSNQLWSQESRGIAGKSEDLDAFGVSLAAGRFTGGAFADLAIGVPFDRVGRFETGAVDIINGSPSGLTAVGSRRWTQNSPGIAGRSEQGDEFGLSLAAGRFAGRASDDLAIGVPYENDNRGAVNVIYGSTTGLSPRSNQIWSQASKGLAGTPEGGVDPDAFGSFLAAGNFGHDEGGRTAEDLAIRVPGESSGPNYETGIVQIVYGSRGGLTAANGQTLTHPGSDEGWSIGAGETALTASNFGYNSGDRIHDDLVIGLANSLDVIYGSGNGLNTKRHRVWSPSNLGHPEVWTGFGDALPA